MNTFSRKKLSYAEALLKARSFCAYQERAHSEVKEKLYSFGLYKEEVEGLIGELIQSNFLSEERFAQAFVSGKFKIKHWGRIKIIAQLKQKGVSANCIKIGLKEIDEADYQQLVHDLAIKKIKSLKDNNPISQQAKVSNYLIGKGFEADVVWSMLKKLFSN